MRLSIDIPDETHRDLKAKAASQGLTISEVVRVAVEQYLHGNFTVGTPTVRPNVGIIEARAVAPPSTPRPKPPPSHIRPISKADQAKGKTRK